jgi:hypothetical protein
MSLPDIGTEITKNAQFILNGILKNFDVPFVDRTAGTAVKFGAFEHKENVISLHPDASILSLSLCSPEGLLDPLFWNLAHGFASLPHAEQASHMTRWNSAVRNVLRCNDVSVDLFENDVKIIFDLKKCDGQMINAITHVLSLTYLKLKTSDKNKLILH